MEYSALRETRGGFPVAFLFLLLIFSAAYSYEKKAGFSLNDGSVEMTQNIRAPLLFLMTNAYWGEQSKCPLRLALKRRARSSILIS